MNNSSVLKIDTEIRNTQIYSNLSQARRGMGARGVRELLQKAINIAKEYQTKEAELVQILSRVDETKAYRLSGFNSLFQFCIEGLDLSEHQAYSSITVARKMKEIPELLEPLKNGRLTVSKVRRMASVINSQNKMEWINLAETVSQKELEKAVRKKDPLPPVLDRMQILAVDKVKLQATLSSETSEKFLRTLELLREKTGKSVKFDEAISQLCDFYLEKVDPLKRAERLQRKKTVLKNSNNKKSTENDLREGSSANWNLGFQKENGKMSNSLVDQIEVNPLESKDKPFNNSVFAQLKSKARKPLPSALKHQIWTRDQGQCRYHRNNKRCSQRIFLQIHHKIPLAKGGKDELENLVLVCSNHHRNLHFESGGSRPRII